MMLVDGPGIEGRRTLAARTSDSPVRGLADVARERHVPTQAEVSMSTRPSLDQIGLSTGKKARLHRRCLSACSTRS
jgi:hypothetical protein